MNINRHKKQDLAKNDYMYTSTELCEIMGNNKSDKGNKDLALTHNYTTLYHKLLHPWRNRKINIFELGLGTNNTDVPSNMGSSGRPGASLYGWAEYFKNARVYGADIDSRVLFNSPRIKTFYCDQTNADSIKKLWSSPELCDIQFDIIVEDGLHCHDAQICFFENSIHKVNVGGYYIIEDIQHDVMFNRHYNTFKSLAKEKHYTNLEVNMYQMPGTSERHKINGWNSLIVIRKLA